MSNELTAVPIIGIIRIFKNYLCQLPGSPSAYFTVTASNGVLPNAIQTFVLTVNQPPAITTANQTTFNFNKKNSFTVKASGFPVPVLSYTGTLPAGVTFTAATGILSGTPTVRGTFPLTFTATSGSGIANQNFTLTVK